MKILLVNPPLRNLYYTVEIVFPPMGLMSLAAYLEKNGHDVSIRDLTIDESPVDYSYADIVGFTCATNQYKAALRLASEAKEEDKPVVMGGVHATFDAESTLKSGYVDYVVRGEGEETLLELCRRLEAEGKEFKPEEIAGLSWYDKDSDSIIHNPERPAISDIGSLPYPARHLVDIKGYSCNLHGREYGTTILSSRGCPFNCSYCVVPNTNGALYRSRKPKSIVDEIESLVTEYGLDAFFFVDDNVTVETERMKQICDEIIKRGLKIGWWCQSRADTLIKNEDMVEKMASSGCQQVFIGFETPNERILKAYNKSLTAEIGEQAVKLLKSYGIPTMGSFMMGEIDETHKEIENTINYSRSLSIDYAQFSILTPFLGTALYEKVKDRIITYDWDKYDGTHSVLRLNNLSSEEIEKLMIKAYKKFYLRFKWIAKKATTVSPKKIFSLLKVLERTF